MRELIGIVVVALILTACGESSENGPDSPRVDGGGQAPQPSVEGGTGDRDAGSERVDAGHSGHEPFDGGPGPREPGVRDGARPSGEGPHDGGGPGAGDGGLRGPDGAGRPDAGRSLGQELSRGKCQGTGTRPLTHVLMRPEDIGNIQPMGLAVGGHVTPIDHQYYYQTDPRAPRDSYPVFAPAAGRVVDVQRRTQFIGEPAAGQPATDEWRIVIAHSCTFFSYVDLMTNLDDAIERQIPPPGTFGMDLDVPVEAGQEIGRVGSQSVDFAVWDLEKPLTGFISPTAYDNAEPWKRFTQPPLAYFTEEVKSAILPKYVRAAEPRDGRIDHDVDGKLVGTWFRAGTNGYLGSKQLGGQGEYWKGHLSIFPDAIDHSSIVFSTGDFGGRAEQFAVEGNTPDPATVDVSTGLVKYVLTQREYVVPAGGRWDQNSVVAGIRVQAGAPRGVALVQMLAARELRVQLFPGKTAAEVSGFTAEAITYDRGDDAVIVLPMGR